MIDQNIQNQNFWDPAGDNVFRGVFDGDKEKLKKVFERYKASPRTPLRNLLLLSIPILLEVILIYLFPEIISILASGDDGDGLYVLFMPFMPALWYIYKIYKLQRDLVKMIIADENNWIYSPSERRERWNKLLNIYPEFLQKGNENQNIQDEFWGKFDGDKQDTDFWSGVFEYTVVTRGSKGRKNRTKHYKTLFALKLNKKLSADFRLEPETSINRFFSFLRKKEINTESAKFNKFFAFYYNGEKADKEIEIIKILSPAVQVRLLDLVNQDSKFGIMFRDETVFFMFSGKLIKKMHTNFFKKVELDFRDQEVIQKRLHTMLEISSEIVPYLD